MPKYEVFLSNAGNPDHAEDPSKCVPGTRSDFWQPVDSFAGASAACRAYIDENELGGGNWTGGQVRDTATGSVVARVSYNGRVWPPGDWTPDMKEISDGPDEGADPDPCGPSP